MFFVFVFVFEWDCQESQKKLTYIAGIYKNKIRIFFILFCFLFSVYTLFYFKEINVVVVLWVSLLLFVCMENINQQQQHGFCLFLKSILCKKRKNPFHSLSLSLVSPIIRLLYKDFLSTYQQWNQNTKKISIDHVWWWSTTRCFCILKSCQRWP